VIDSGLLVVKQSATSEPTPSSPNSGSTLVHIRRLVDRREIGARGKEYLEMPVARTREIVAVCKEKANPRGQDWRRQFEGTGTVLNRSTKAGETDLK
jgi:hypothetical protein